MPTPSKDGNPNLNKGTNKKPVIIDAMAPFSLNFFQKIDRIMVGQNVAAMPDQPKMTNQNIVLPGTSNATANAIKRARMARTKVIHREVFANFSSGL